MQSRSSLHPQPFPLRCRFFALPHSNARNTSSLQPPSPTRGEGGDSASWCGKSPSPLVGEGLGRGESGKNPTLESPPPAPPPPGGRGVGRLPDALSPPSPLVGEGGRGGEGDNLGGLCISPARLFVGCLTDYDPRSIIRNVEQTACRSGGIGRRATFRA